MVIKYLVTGLVALMVLGGCENKAGGDGALGFGLSNLASPKPAPVQVRVAGKEVVIAGPKGFCVDPTQIRDRAANAFVLLGSCRAISNSPLKPKPQVPAILVATVSGKTKSAPIASSMDTLTKFFKSSAGRAALSRDGRAQTVEVIQTLKRQDIFYIHARDSSTDALAGAGDEYWRALFNVKGRIVSASVVGLQEQPITSKAGFDTLAIFANKIMIANKPSASKKPATTFFEQLFKKDPV